MIITGKKDNTFCLYYSIFQNVKATQLNPKYKLRHALLSTHTPLFGALASREYSCCRNTFSSPRRGKYL